MKSDESRQEIIRPDLGTSVVTETMIEDGWAKILRVVSPSLIFIQMESTIDMLRTMETSMDKFLQ